MAFNGGSLEDCFSNVFTLTELHNLKWRCFVTPGNAPRGVPVPSDSVLQAYGKCLQDGLVCTWRRKPLPLPPQPEPIPIPSFTNDISKELWVFWYSTDPPESLATHTSKLENLSCGSNGVDENGGGSSANVIPYEVRVLFFKALHTMIERTMSKTGIIRMGRWFAKPLRQPLSGRQHLISHYMLAYNIQFFIHGGNAVCMTLNAQRQPTLLRLSKRHLQCGARIQVILGPWSLRGILLPSSECEESLRSQGQADRQWEEWKQFVPLETEADGVADDDNKKEENVPRMVTVEVDGIRMLYPSSLVCLTLEDDSTSQRCADEAAKAKAQAETQEPQGCGVPVLDKTAAAPARRRPTHPEMTPAEHIAADGSRRNPLLVSNVHGFTHLQGVLQNAYLGKRQSQSTSTSQHDTFREPYAVQPDDETKWNFVDPARSDVCNRHCSSCSFQPPRGFRGDSPNTPAIDCELAHPIPITNPAAENQKRTHPAYYALRRQSRRKTQHSYHRRWTAGADQVAGDAPSVPTPSTSAPGTSTAPTAVVSRSRSPMSEASSECPSEDEIVPGWASSTQKGFAAGIHVEQAATHYKPMSTALSSDDENMNISPFTPIKVISPCSHSCAWPSTAPELMPETTFNEIFKQGSSRVPQSASQEERARDYDHYYNPTLRDEPSYASYHSKRRDKRRSSYPPQIAMPSSPEQPGSQETIPATSSPPPELEERQRSNDGTAPGFRILPTASSSADEMVPRTRRMRKLRRHTDWPEVELLNVAATATNNREDVSCKVGPSCGRLSPLDNDDTSSVDQYEADSEECSLGEGTSSQYIPEYSSGMENRDEAMMSALALAAMEFDGPMDNILSPPASNERFDAFGQQSSQWPRMGGPPSVGDTASMNQIYPTPPSVLVESQQFSPVAAPPVSYAGNCTTLPHSQVVTSQHNEAHPIMAADLMTTTSTLRTVKQEAADEPMETSEADMYRHEPSPPSPQYVEEPEEPETYPVSETSRLVGLLSKVSVVPVSGRARKFVISASGRFNLPEKNSSMGRRLAANSASSTRPPIYRKEVAALRGGEVPATATRPPHHHHSLRKQLPLVGSVAGGAAYSMNIPSASGSNMVPLTMTGVDRLEQHYKTCFNPNVPHSPFNQPQQPMHMQNHMGAPYGHNPQMVGRPGSIPPPMMPGRGMPPSPYGAPGQIPGYRGHQNPVPVQQLNNFVNGPMQPMYGMGMGGPGGPPMGSHHMGSPHMSMYPGQQQMMQPGGPGSVGMMPYGMDHMGSQSPMTPSGYGPPSQFGHPGGSMQQQQALMHQQQQMRSQNMHPMNMQHAGGGYPGSQMPQPGMGGGGHQQMMMGAGGMMPHHPQLHQQQLPHYSQYPMHPNQMHQQQQQHMQQQQQQLAVAAPKEPAHAEGSSVVLAIILQDTILDLHYDTVFDSCPICSCNTSIKARELGLYITPSDVLRMPPDQQKLSIREWSGFFVSQNQSNACNCGFSAVRHRYLSYQSGLFPEDSKEATATESENSVATVAMHLTDFNLPINSPIWFDPSSANDVYMLNLIRVLCLKQPAGSIVHHISSFTENADKATKGQGIGFTIGSNAEYLVSQIDSTELMLLGNSTIDMALVSSPGKRVSTSTNEHRFLDYFHPWGLQVANEMRELKEAEWRGLLSELAPSLENAMRLVRCTEVGSTNTMVSEGPLTWKALTNKRQKTSDDDSYLPEPIPYVMVATEKDLIRCAPQAIRLWEQLSLGPVDQPKDILYLTVIPDSAEIHEKATKFMDQLSQLYERMRLGRHIAYSGTEARDGIVRVGGRNSAVNNLTGSSFDFLDMVGRHVDKDHRVFFTRLRLFTQQMEAMLNSLLKNDSDNIFDRSTYRLELAKDSAAKRAAHAATAAAVDRSGATSSAGGGDGGPTSMDNSDGAGSGQSGPDNMSPMGAPSTSEQHDIKPNITLTATFPDLPMDNSSMQIPKIEPGLEQQPSTSGGATAIDQKVDIQQQVLDVPTDDFGTLPHVIVIYVVNPFSWGSDQRNATCARASWLALLRSFNAVCAQLPAKYRPQLQLEILSMEQFGDKLSMIPDFTDGRGHMDVYDRSESGDLYEGFVRADSLRATAMSVYTAPRVLTADCVSTVQARYMTNFGPGSQLMSTVGELEQLLQPTLFMVPCTAYHLAPPPMLAQVPDAGSALKVVEFPQDEQVLYVTYCLIGGEFLCAAVTDAEGKLNDSVLINIRAPTRAGASVKYRANTQILDAMSRLWSWIQGVMSVGLCHWRLVIGRLGKIGHGEFRAWTHLLTKAVLHKMSNKSKESCPSCVNIPGVISVPSVLSACLVSTEPEPYMRIFPGFFSNENTTKSNKQRSLSTPEDVSCTHIMVFPVSPGIDLSVSDTAIVDDDIAMDDDIFGVDLTGDDEVANMQDLMIFNDMDGNDGGAQPSASIRQGGSSFFSDNYSTESLENQPLATGMFVSTAPPGDLPDWFWAPCPSAKRRNPVHLRSSLHINVQCAAGDQDQDQGDDLMGSKSSATAKRDNAHPLDTRQTDQVLRHVLETYNALSWLNVDVSTGDRSCCLPVHMQALLRLYHSVTRLVV